MENERVNVLCLKWGRRYPASYVNRLYQGVKRNLSRPFRFVCVTDNAEGFLPGIEAVPFPENPDVQGRRWPNIFIKLVLFRKGFANLSGPTLFLDVDVLVSGPLDRFFDYAPGDFCIIYNWIERRKRIFRKVPEIGNSSCFRFDAGSDVANRVYEIFLRDKGRKDLWAKYLSFGSQKFQTRAMKEAGTVRWWPDDWVCSFKRQCIPPFPLNKFLVPRFRNGSSVIAFHGKPDITEVIEGYRADGTLRTTHLTCLPTPWVKDLWCAGEEHAIG